MPNKIKELESTYQRVKINLLTSISLLDDNIELRNDIKFIIIELINYPTQWNNNTYGLFRLIRENLSNYNVEDYQDKKTFMTIFYLHTYGGNSISHLKKGQMPNVDEVPREVLYFKWPHKETQSYLTVPFFQLIEECISHIKEQI